MLGITIDYNLKFDDHVTNLCDKVSQKLNALARICRFIDMKKRRMIFKAFISSQFSYCPLVWMFHKRELNNRINRLHERSLRLVYQEQSKLTIFRRAFANRQVCDNSPKKSTIFSNRNL